MPDKGPTSKVRIGVLEPPLRPREHPCIPRGRLEQALHQVARIPPSEVEPRQAPLKEPVAPTVDLQQSLEHVVGRRFTMPEREPLVGPCNRGCYLPSEKRAKGEADTALATVVSDPVEDRRWRGGESRAFQELQSDIPPRKVRPGSGQKSLGCRNKVWISERRSEAAFEQARCGGMTEVCLNPASNERPETDVPDSRHGIPSDRQPLVPAWGCLKQAKDCIEGVVALTLGHLTKVLEELVTREPKPTLSGALSTGLPDTFLDRVRP